MDRFDVIITALLAALGCDVTGDGWVITRPDGRPLAKPWHISSIGGDLL